MLLYLKKSVLPGQLLVVLLVLTFSLLIESPVLADDNRPHNMVVGGFGWEYPGCPGIAPPAGGRRQIALKVPRDGNQDEVSGWIYSYRAANEYWPESWMIAIPIEEPGWSECGFPPGYEGPVVKVIDEKPTEWLVGCPGSTDTAEGKVVLGAFEIVSSSNPDPGPDPLYTIVWGLDGGPGREDYLHVLLSSTDKCLMLQWYYFAPYYRHLWSIPTNVVKGNLVIE